MIQLRSNAYVFVLLIAHARGQDHPTLPPYFEHGKALAPGESAVEFASELVAPPPGNRDLSADILKAVAEHGPLIAESVECWLRQTTTSSTSQIPYHDTNTALAAIKTAAWKSDDKRLRYRGFAFPADYQGAVTHAPHKQALATANRLLGHRYGAADYSWSQAQGCRIIPCTGQTWATALTAIKSFDRNLDQYPRWPLEERYARATLISWHAPSSTHQLSLVDYTLQRGYTYRLATRDKLSLVGKLNYLVTSYYALRTRKDTLFWHMSGQDTYVPLAKADGTVVAVIAVTCLTYDITSFSGESPEATVRENLGTIAYEAEKRLTKARR